MAMSSSASQSSRIVAGSAASRTRASIQRVSSYDARSGCPAIFSARALRTGSSSKRRRHQPHVPGVAAQLGVVGEADERNSRRLARPAARRVPRSGRAVRCRRRAGRAHATASSRVAGPSTRQSWGYSQPDGEHVAGQLHVAAGDGHERVCAPVEQVRRVLRRATRRGRRPGGAAPRPSAPTSPIASTRRRRASTASSAPSTSTLAHQEPAPSTTASSVVTGTSLVVPARRGRRRPAGRGTTVPDQSPSTANVAVPARSDTASERRSNVDAVVGAGPFQVGVQREVRFEADHAAHRRGSARRRASRRS